MSYGYLDTTEEFKNSNEDTICMSQLAANSGLGCGTVEGFEGRHRGGGHHGGGGYYGGRRYYGGRGYYGGGYYGGYYAYPYGLDPYYYAPPQITKIVQAPPQSSTTNNTKLIALTALAVGVLALYKK